MKFIAKIICEKWFYTMGRCFAAVFHGVENLRPARLKGGWAPRAAGSGRGGGKDDGQPPEVPGRLTRLRGH